MFVYQQDMRFFAQTTDGSDEVASQELAELGATDVKAVYRGLYFSADHETLYRVTYCASTITRVLAPLETLDCHSAKYLYKRARALEWPRIFGLRNTFSVSANVSNSAIRHSGYAALQVKDAIADCFRDATGERPDVSPHEADVRVNVHIQGNRATLALDVSGGSMHRRGYRVATVDAPMQEHVAAAIIRMTGWDGERPLVDPMCGSGTLLAEALMRYCRVPSGYLRKGPPPLRFLPDFDGAAWRSVKASAERAIRDLPHGLISGSDMSQQAIAAARQNLECLPGGRRVILSRRRYEEIESIEGAAIVTNPPYGLRIGSRDGMPEFIKGFGDVLKHRCTGSTAYIYFGTRQLLKSLGLRTAWKRPLAHGGLDGRLVRIDLY